MEYLEMACGCKMDKKTFEMVYKPNCIVVQYLAEKETKEAKNV